METIVSKTGGSCSTNEITYYPELTFGKSHLSHLKEIAGAVSKMQSKLAGAHADSNNPFFNSKYADLKAIWEAIRGPLTDNGLSVIQITEMHGEQLMVRTILLHTSGESIQGIMPVLAKDKSPQAMGSGISYARRYALASIVGVYQDDDDGEYAQRSYREKDTAQNRVKDPVQRDGNRVGAHETRKSGVKGGEQNSPINEQKAQSADSEPKEKDENIISPAEAVMLITRLKLLKKDTYEFYSWLDKKYGTSFPNNLKKWQHDEVIAWLDKK